VTAPRHILYLRLRETAGVPIRPAHIVPTDPDVELPLILKALCPIPLPRDAVESVAEPGRNLCVDCFDVLAAIQRAASPHQSPCRATRLS
jgi:hypothetical protein